MPFKIVLGPHGFELQATTNADDARQMMAMGGKPVPKRQIHPVAAEPTYTGLHGLVWEQNWPMVLERNGVKPEDDAIVGSWVIRAPYAHPFWYDYWLYVIHLRDMPDRRETKFYLPGATHELCLFALDPDRTNVDRMLAGDKFGPGVIVYLTPKQFASQMIYASDEEAHAQVAAAARDVADGKLNPDVDHQAAWGIRFGTSMIKAEYR